jgi:VanZ family protein
VNFWPHLLPARIKRAAYGVAVAVLLYLCLAPSQALPKEHLWDKAEHAIAWFVLAALGLALWPRRPGRVTFFALALGALVEVLQWAMPFGRDGDWRDWIADSVGVAAALLVWAAVLKLAPPDAFPKRRLSRKR